MIWGHWDRDTYYVCKWFHEKGIEQLQYAPEGLTAIIVKITYESTRRLQADRLQHTRMPRNNKRN